MSALHGNMRKLMVKDGSGKDVALYLSTEVKGVLHLRTDRKDYYIRESEITSALYELFTGKKFGATKHGKADPDASK